MNDWKDGLPADADGKIKLSDIEEYLDRIVEDKVSKALRKYGIAADDPVAERVRAEKTRENASSIPHAAGSSAPLGISSIFEPIDGAPEFVFSVTEPAAAIQSEIPVATKIVSPFDLSENVANPFETSGIEPAKAIASGSGVEPVGSSSSKPDAEEPKTIISPFDLSNNVANPFASSGDVGASGAEEPSEKKISPARASEPVAPIEKFKDESAIAPIAPAEISRRESEINAPRAKEPFVSSPFAATDISSSLDKQLETADEDFSQEVDRVFGSRGTGGTISFDTNRPRVKEIIDKFEPLVKNVGAEQF
ncbi:MAG: hypothetical protein LBH63_05170, partial [Clostridiales Family XIII bacterium]|nr:hypothetical protein [Clostridiales Family XIII bacterium]